MTAKEIQKRNAKAESLKVLLSEDGQFFVESERGKILYNVILDDEETSCTCGDFAKNSKKDSNFRCKHILSVMNAIPKREVENARFCEKQVPRLDDRFMTNIKGKDFVLYAGVLDLATQKGLLKLEVELLQFPTKENGNEAICRAVAESKTGEVFSDIGDANPKNCHAMIVKHLIRMASTRAKGRALRDMCNIGIACIEELADFDDVIGSSSPKKTTRKRAAGNTTKKATPAKTDTKKKPPVKDKPESKRD
jgi:predicted nucleic acid-binding Zn finger protein